MLYTNYEAKGKHLHTFICRVATYPVDKISIRSLNNRAQAYKIRTHFQATFLEFEFHIRFCKLPDQNG